MIVPNLFPTRPSLHRIALIGEAPGADEEKMGQPFVGMSGRFLSALLGKTGLSREACFLGNVSQHRPPGNDISLFPWDGIQIQHGLDQLRLDIEKFNPNLVVLLGNVPLKAAKDCANPYHGKKYKFSNTNWRGSLFICDDKDSPFYGRKCLSTLHPAFVIRDYGQMPLLFFDLKKAYAEGTRPNLITLERKAVVPTTIQEALGYIAILQQTKETLGTDIEGYVKRLQCIAFAPTKTLAYVFPFLRRNGTPYWTNVQEEIQLWKAIALLLESYSVPKTWQNGLYDRFVLHFGHQIRVCNSDNDIMLEHWELNSELSKGDNNEDKRKKGLSLAIQTSIYTDLPYYKSDYKSEDDLTFYRYNGLDACVTKEIHEKVNSCLTASCSRRHYQLNVALLNPLLYMELIGIRYDSLAAASRQQELRRQLYTAQAKLNAMTGYGFTWTSKKEILDRAISVMAFKKATIADFPDLRGNVRKPYIDAANRLLVLFNQRNPDLAVIGEIEDLCDASLNLSSDDQFIPFLYETLRLPVQHTNTRGKDPRPTADYEALLKLARHLTQHNDQANLAIIHQCIEIRALETRQRMLGISADFDGRIRCGYNIVGSNTGRITCYESPTGSGYNLQTIPNYTNVTDAPGGVLGDRDLFLADDGCWFGQCDLKGADGWTVAAYCAMFGDRTMLDDYGAGIKPYIVLALKLRGYPVNFKDRDDIKAWSKKVEKEAWDAFASKRVQHGGAYLEGDLTISRNILKDSEGKLYLPPTECGQIKAFYFERYPGIRKWHNWTQSRLKERPVLVAASGQVREFFGRPDEILTKAVAFEPQANTTYATNLAMYRLWNDPENRVADELGRIILRVKPLHQVHDALLTQFQKQDTNWAITKIQSWFNNEITIAGQKLVIPYDGAYGASWGNLNEGKL